MPGWRITLPWSRDRPQAEVNGHFDIDNILKPPAREKRSALIAFAAWRLGDGRP